MWQISHFLVYKLHKLRCFLWILADCAAADVGNSTNVLNYTAQGAQREYTCDPGYEFLDGNVTKIVLCDEGSVSGELPTCSRECRDFSCITNLGSLFSSVCVTYFCSPNG